MKERENAGRKISDILKMRERLEKKGCDLCNTKINAVYEQRGSLIICYKCANKEGE